MFVHSVWSNRSAKNRKNVTFTYAINVQYFFNAGKHAVHKHVNMQIYFYPTKRQTTYSHVSAPVDVSSRSDQT